MSQNDNLSTNDTAKNISGKVDSNDRSMADDKQGQNGKGGQGGQSDSDSKGSKQGGHSSTESHS